MEGRGTTGCTTTGFKGRNWLFAGYIWSLREIEWHIRLCSRAHCLARLWVCSDHSDRSPSHWNRPWQDSPRLTSGACINPPLCLVRGFCSRWFLPQARSYDSTSVFISFALHKFILINSRDLFLVIICISLIISNNYCSIN